MTIESIKHRWRDLPKPYFPFLRLYLKWFDLWIGAYYDQIGETLYLQALPCIGIEVRVWSFRNWWRAIRRGSTCATCGRPFWLTDKDGCIPF